MPDAPETYPRPLIALSMDHEEGGEGKYSRFPWHALRSNYMTAIEMAGGLAAGITPPPEVCALVLQRFDGLIITGGAFDVDPDLYGGGTRHATTSPRPARTTSELTLLREAHRIGMPILGICGGMQLMAVAMGGTLFQHIPDDVPSALEHEQTTPRDQPGHTIRLSPGSKLAGIAQTDVMQVNSSHHQAVKSPGSLQIAARSPDGVIEAVEMEGPFFFIGVQWHPEFCIDPADKRIFSAFIAAAQRFAAARNEAARQQNGSTKEKQGE